MAPLRTSAPRRWSSEPVPPSISSVSPASSLSTIVLDGMLSPRFVSPIPGASLGQAVYFVQRTIAHPGPLTTVGGATAPVSALAAKRSSKPIHVVQGCVLRNAAAQSNLCAVESLSTNLQRAPAGSVRGWDESTYLISGIGSPWSYIDLAVIGTNPARRSLDLIAEGRRPSSDAISGIECPDSNRFMRRSSSRDDHLS